MKRVIDDLDASAATKLRRMQHPIWLAILALELGCLRHYLSHVPVTIWALYNVALVYALQTVSIVLHELGHALGGWLVGFRINLVRVGRGRIVWERTFRGCVYRLRALPVSGLTSARYEPELSQRRRLAVYIFGGVGMHLALLGLTCLVLSPSRVLAVLDGSGAFFSRPSGVEIFVWLQLALFVLNIIPVRSQQVLGTRKLWRDGGEAIRALFASDADLRERAAACRMQDVVDAAYQSDLPRSLIEVDRALALQPDRPGAHFMRGAVLVDLGRYAEALPEIERELTDDRKRAKPAHAPWLMLVTYATAVYGMRDPERVREADQALDVAMAVASGHHLTTRAAKLRIALHEAHQLTTR